MFNNEPTIFPQEENLISFPGAIALIWSSVATLQRLNTYFALKHKVEVFYSTWNEVYQSTQMLTYHQQTWVPSLTFHQKALQMRHLHCSTLDSILMYEKEWIWNCLCIHYFHCLQICLLFNLTWSLYSLHPNHLVDHPLFDQELLCSTMDSILKWKGIFIKFIMQLSLLFNLTWSFISLLLPQCIQITM